MTYHPSTRRPGLSGLLLALVLFLCPITLLNGADPAWWAARGVLTADQKSDYAAINQGQLKTLARAAMDELEFRLPAIAGQAGAGSAIHALVASWLDQSAPGEASDFSAVTIGQLKTVALPFYNRLGILSRLTVAGMAPNDFAMANIGQAKTLFAFDFLVDTDSDDVPDLVETALGTNPLEPPPTSDTDGDGISDVEEIANGTNPNKADSDDDWTPDGTDRYPNDPRRSEDIPVTFYGVIALPEVENPSAPPLPRLETTAISIGDDNRVAWVTEFGTSFGGADSITKVYGWEKGVLQGVSSFPQEIVEGTDYRRSFYSIGITPGSRVTGFTGVWDFRIQNTHTNEWYESFSFKNGVFSEVSRPALDYSLGEGQPPWLIYNFTSRLGIKVGTLGKIRNSEPYFAMCREEERLTGKYSPSAVSDQGHVVATSDTSPGILWAIDGTVTSMPGCPVAVNDQQQVVGRTSDTDPEGNPLGFFWEPGESQTTPRLFNTLLPGEFQKQLRRAIPYLITNVDPETNKPRIMFRAEGLEGNAGSWIPHVYLLKWTTDGKALVDRIRLPSVYDPQLGDSRELTVDFTQCNQQTAAVGRVENPLYVQAGSPLPPPAGISPDFPGVLMETKFKARGPFSEGFDPPMVGDVDPLTGARDVDGDNWVPWTSVTKSGPLAVNLRTKVVFSDAAQASHFEIVAASKDGEPFPDQNAGLISVWPHGTPLTSAETDLMIWGNGGNNDIEDAFILIRTADARKQEVWRMRVMVLPPVPPINLRFYYIGTGDVPNGPGVASPAQIVNEIKELFAPAGITVQTTDTDYTSSSVENAVGGDCNFLLTGMFFDKDNKVVRGENTAPTQIQLNSLYFELRARHEGYGTENPEGVKDVMERTAAHEFGHFRALSTREELYTYSKVGHDIWGPTNSNPRVGSTTLLVRALMRQGTEGAPGRWIRHEDWRVANKPKEKNP